MAEDQGRENIDSGADEKIDEAAGQIAEPLRDLDESGVVAQEIERETATLLKKGILEAQNRKKAELEQAKETLDEEQRLEQIYGKKEKNEKKPKDRGPSNHEAPKEGEIPEAETDSAGIKRADATSPKKNEGEDEKEIPIGKQPSEEVVQKKERQRRLDPEMQKTDEPFGAPIQKTEEGIPEGISRADEPSKESAETKKKAEVQEGGPEKSEKIKARRLRQAKAEVNQQAKLQQQIQEQQQAQAREKEAQQSEEKIKRLERIRNFLKILLGASGCCSSCLTLTVVFSIFGFIIGGVSIVLILIPMLIISARIRTLRLKEKLRK